MREFRASLQGLNIGETGKAFWFLFSGSRLLVSTDGRKATVPFLDSPHEIGADAKEADPFGAIDAFLCSCADAGADYVPPPGMTLAGLRGLWDLLEEPFLRAAMVAFHTVHTNRTVRFCSRCGTPLQPKEGERARECPACGLVVFPRISPAVIVRVDRDDTILLARAAHFAPRLYSVLAGFVEAGETLEEAVRREVAEETGIEVTDISYFGSQFWPFPDSLMIGFTARYGKGEIRVDGTEIVEAGWFSPNRFPEIPNKISISRRLIDAFASR